MNTYNSARNWFYFLGLAMLVSISCSRVGRAEIIQFNITTDKATYNAGEQVEWQIRFDIGSSTAATNFGVSALSVDLVDSFGDTLSAGTINLTTSPSFSAYDFSSAGTWDAPTSKLYEITVLEFTQSTDIVGLHANQTNNILFASGSYTPTTEGIHNLLGTPGSTNTHFSALGQSFVQATPFQSVAFSNATFTVTSVPEPSSMVLLCIAGGICLAHRKRSNPRFLSPSQNNESNFSDTFTTN